MQAVTRKAELDCRAQALTKKIALEKEEFELEEIGRQKEFGKSPSTPKGYKSHGYGAATAEGVVANGNRNHLLWKKSNL